MSDVQLQNAVYEFTRMVCRLTDRDLDRPWKWGDYDEGVRFAIFRLYETLRDLAARVSVARVRAGAPFTHAQRILAQYLSAYQDLQAILFDLSDEQAQIAPAEGEWPVRKALLHLIEAEGTFFAINLYAIERARAKDGRPLAMPDEAWNAFWAGDPFDHLAETGSLADLLSYHAGLHTRILEAFTGISEAELEEPAMFWESSPMPVRFRLHRFDSHLRQHTVQIEKTLAAIGLGLNEARRLLRLVFQALAEVQGCRLGAGSLGAGEIQQATTAIEGLAAEIRAVLRA